MNYTKITLGELLSSTNQIIKRNALSVLKQLQVTYGKCSGKHKTTDELFKCSECVKLFTCAECEKTNGMMCDTHNLLHS